jgi:hypothetical protein
MEIYILVLVIVVLTLVIILGRILNRISEVLQILKTLPGGNIDSVELQIQIDKLNTISKKLADAIKDNTLKEML